MSHAAKNCGQSLDRVGAGGVYWSAKKQFAAHLGWTYARLNDIINGRRSVTAGSALVLGDALKTGPVFWMNLQRDWDLWSSLQQHEKIPPLKKAS